MSFIYDNQIHIYCLHCYGFNRFYFVVYRFIIIYPQMMSKFETLEKLRLSLAEVTFKFNSPGYII